MQKQLDRIERSVAKVAESKDMATSSSSLQLEVKVMNIVVLMPKRYLLYNCG